MHGKHDHPLLGAAECERVLGQTARALRWLRAEVVRLMNAGCNERQMLAALKPPAELFDQPWMRPTYGDPSYIARDIYRSENGWWDRNATTLHPAAPEIAAAVADRGETQLALHVIDVLALAPGDAPTLAEARRLKATWLRQRASQVRSYDSRSLYGAAADMLEHDAADTFGIH